MARAGVGVDNIDIHAATSYGIIVVNSPQGNIAAAAEHTIALLLATARNVGRADAGVKGGKWERGKLVGVEVGAKTLGLIGLGKVGMKVARMAIGLGMKVVAVDPYMSVEVARANGVKMVEGGTLQDLLPVVDFLTIHTPLLASTLNLLGEKELRMMKKTARVLNVARGGVYNEEALVKALDEGWIAGAGIDVFTSEPPEAGTNAARLAGHPKVVVSSSSLILSSIWTGETGRFSIIVNENAWSDVYFVWYQSTPHLGASTVEAQENVSLDVCNQVVEILRGGLPTAAVNAPLILPEEYRKLQPFVRLVERMGDLYTQHFVGGKGGMIGGSKFELVYHGELASVSNTRPLLAALIKGLTSSISDSAGRDVNIVNAQLIAKEKGIAINETHAREEGGAESAGYASLVTLRSYDVVVGAGGGAEKQTEKVIEGYVSGQSFYISKLGRFRANFVPEGMMVLLHNYDEPGKIGNVGIVLGSHGVNITFMQVASLDRLGGVGDSKRDDTQVGTGGSERAGKKGENEALMILGVDGAVTGEVVEALRRSEGILDVNLVKL